MTIETLLEEFEAERAGLIDQIKSDSDLTYTEGTILSGSTNTAVFFEWACVIGNLLNPSSISLTMTAYADEAKGAGGFDLIVNVEPEISYMSMSRKVHKIEDLPALAFSALNLLMNAGAGGE